jgi:hypothetical protein
MIAVFVTGICFLTAADAACADFLAKLQKKPAHLEYLSCKQHSGSEGDSWTAEYRVAGTYAAGVEDYLVKNFKLPRLKKSCCQWDGPAADYTRGGAHYEITMTSDEDSPAAVTTRRSDWGKLPYFHVMVQYYAPE